MLFLFAVIKSSDNNNLREKGFVLQLHYTTYHRSVSSKTLSTLVTLCPNQEQTIVDYTHKIALSLLSALINNPAYSVLGKSSNSNWYNQFNPEQTCFDQPNVNHSINFLPRNCVKLIVKSSHHTWLSLSFYLFFFFIIKIY